MSACLAVAVASALTACVGGVAGGVSDAGTAMDPGPVTGDDSGLSPPRDSSMSPPRDDGGAAPPQDGQTPAPGEDADVPPPPPPDSGSNPGDGNDSGTGNPPPVDAGMTGTGTKPVFVVVGEKGARLVSRDLGKTWTQTAQLVGGGDDGNMLRSVAFGKGMFVAVGWNIWTSTDGSTWTKRDNPAQQWFGGIEYGVPTGKTDAIFVAAGGVGTGVFSSDGVTWTKAKDRNGEHARSVAYGNGKFLCGTDPRKWWSTTDGNTWTVDSSDHETNQVMWCNGSFSEVKNCTTALAHGNGRTAVGMGVYVSATGYEIQRSEDGVTWTKVMDTKDFPVADVAFGMLP